MSGQRDPGAGPERPDSPPGDPPDWPESPRSDPVPEGGQDDGAPDGRDAGTEEG